MFAVSVTLPPAQNVVGPDGVIVGEGGGGPPEGLISRWFAGPDRLRFSVIQSSLATTRREG
jgi:hypothetical protein